jgi:hypothetical protein
VIFFLKAALQPLYLPKTNDFGPSVIELFGEKSVAKLILRYILKQDFDTIAKLKSIKVFYEVLNWILYAL